ncbi:hypothetical protein KCP77_14830 [Salmonella enterica subsp. enterica]|nr:hypothetical protein KCP77_14830 [Salmonella enterica subsp. enterica]
MKGNTRESFQNYSSRFNIAGPKLAAKEEDFNFSSYPRRHNSPLTPVLPEQALPAEPLLRHILTTLFAIWITRWQRFPISELC